MTLHSETDTVVKRIMPYLRRRGYDIEADIDFETATKHPERYTKGYIDLLVTCGKSKPFFLIEAKRSTRNLTEKDAKQAVDYGRSQKVPFVILTNGQDIRAYNVKNGKPARWNGQLTEKIPSKDQLKAVMAALRADPDATDIPLGSDDSLPFRPGLPLKQLNALYARCHNAIRKIEKNEEHAFDDFSKLLFLKLLEEKEDVEDFSLPYSYRFHELAERPESESDQVRNAIENMVAKREKSADTVLSRRPIFSSSNSPWWRLVSLPLERGYDFSTFNPSARSLNHRQRVVSERVYLIRSLVRGEAADEASQAVPHFNVMASPCHASWRSHAMCG